MIAVEALPHFMLLPFPEVKRERPTQTMEDRHIGRLWPDSGCHALGA